MGIHFDTAVSVCTAGCSANNDYRMRW
jgi:hypothetical protein